MVPAKETANQIRDPDGRGWLHELDRAFDSHDAELAARLFHVDGSWRDILALTGSIRSVGGPKGIVALLNEAWDHSHRRRFRVAGQPRTDHVTRYGIGMAEVSFDFETENGFGAGIVRLTRGSHGAAPPKGALSC